MASTKNLRRLQIVIAGTLVLTALSITTMRSFKVTSNFAFLFGDGHTLERVRGFMIDTAGCRVPYKGPWDPLVKGFITNESALNCRKKLYLPQLVDSNNTSLFMIETGVTAYKLSKDGSLGGEISCCYRELRRKSPEEYVDFKKPYVNESCTNFEKKNMEEEEFVQVECSVNKKKIFRDVHAFVPLKPEVEKRCRKLEDKSWANGKKPNVSVLILGVDSLSRLHFYRQMQETHSALKDMDAIELEVHNTQIEITTPNLGALLTGLRISELQQTCVNSSGLVDECPFLWKKFQHAGFRTAYGEDDSIINTFNIFGLYGFRNQPTDYYLRPYMIHSEGKFGHRFQGNIPTCISNRPIWDEFLNYVTKFVQVMSTRRYFGFFWSSSVCHDNLNYAKLGDSSYQKFMRMFKESGLSNEAVLIFMSDHGKRDHGILATYQGRLELRNPVVFFVFPEWMKRMYPLALQNVRLNSHQLTSHYDIYETVRDLLDFNQLTDRSIKLRTMVDGNMSPLGRSLFLPISDSRTCAHIGIDDKWCMCQHKTPMKVTEEAVIFSAQVIVNHVNSLTGVHKNCVPLKLAKVLEAFVETPPDGLYDEMKHKDGVKDFTVVFSVAPGDMIFNSTLRYLPGNDYKNKFVLPRNVEVINYHGGNKGCVSDETLESYCYCNKNSTS